MTYLIIIVGFIGSIASIISIFLSKSRKYPRIIHIIYILFIVLLTSISLFYSTKYNQILDASCEASILLKKKNNLSAVGFNLAAIALLDKNKDLFEKSLLLAIEVCENSKCTESRYSDSNINTMHGFGLIEASSSISGILEGISDEKKCHK